MRFGLVMKKYVLHPGYIRSKNENEPVFISAFILARLYGVDIHQCIISSNLEKENADDLIHLYPNHEGEYRLPKSEST